MPAHPFINRYLEAVHGIALLLANFKEWTLLPNVIDEFSERMTVLELVRVVVAAILVEVKLPPLKLICVAAVAAVALGLTLYSPSVMVVVPEYVLAVLVIKSVPAPNLVGEAVVLTIPMKVKSGADEPSSATEMSYEAELSDTGQDMDAPAVPAPASVTLTFPPRVSKPVPVMDEPAEAPPQ